MVVADRPCLQPQLRYLLDRLSRQTLALCQNAAAPEDQPLPRYNCQNVGMGILSRKNNLGNGLMSFRKKFPG